MTRSELGGALLGAALVLALAAPAGAGTIYAWRTDDGGYAFADDLRRVPERYRDRVETRQSASVKDHPRYTPTDPVATAAYASELERRLTALRQRNEHLRRLVEAPVPQRRADEGLTVRLSSNGEAVIDVPPSATGDGEPLVIEDVLAKPDNDVRTRTNTVIRRGDEILAIVRPLDAVPTPNYPTESELEEGGF